MLVKGHEETKLHVCFQIPSVAGSRSLGLHTLFSSMNTRPTVETAAEDYSKL